MKSSTIRIWYLVHKWTSLICTIFLMMLCVTGLPLIFHDEIDALLGHEPAPMTGLGSSGEGPGLLPLDTMLEKALAQRPGEVPLFMAFDNTTPVLTITTGPAPDSPADEMTIQLFDRSTGEPAGQVSEGEGVMGFILELHTDMFLGLPGMLFLGVMGILFVVATLSGVVLYAPFMRRLAFGTLRVSRSKRLKQLDYHNLLGIVALAWIVVVGSTGVINAFATPLIQFWQQSELAEMTAAYQGVEPLPPSRYGSLDKAMAAARAARPGNNPQFIAFPGGAYSSQHHYAVFLQGDTALTERMLTPALIDAETGKLTDVRPLPWYLTALLFSQPLHFGDYGGLPLKLIWSVLTLATVWILWTGVLLWLRREPGAVERRIVEIHSGGTAGEAA
ncbi:MAG: PepSY domain-containing protein [Porphyrobacter sp.]|nr:PepSY domain-containing protein [Porphyrobacter sp.]